MSTNITINANGSDAYKSTTNPLLDFYVRVSKNPDMEYDNFKCLFTEMYSGFERNPSSFIKLLNFQRNILGGNGIRMYLWLGLSIAKVNMSSDLYIELVIWLKQYSKDLYQLSRLANFSNERLELDIYAKNVYNQLLKLLTGDTLDLDLMSFKYLSHKGEHWISETVYIWKKVGEYLKQNSDFKQILQRTTSLPNHNNLGDDIRKLFNDNYKNTISPKLQRKLKVCVNSRLHLTDYLLAGKHFDGSLFNFSKLDEKSESLKIATEIGQCASIATSKLLQTISSLKNKPDILTDTQKLLISGSDNYFELLKLKKIVAKEVGVDLSKEVYNYYINNNNKDILLENQIKERIDRIREQVMPMFTNNFSLIDFVNSFICIMDRSGSMSGTPLESGLFQLLVMTILFRVKNIIYFDSNIEVKKVTEDDLDGSILKLVKKIYTSVQGSTELIKALDYLETIKASNKNVVIITDSDCDPYIYSNNPFHSALNCLINRYLPTNRYIILNVKETKMSFPYLNFHKNVSYINGICCLDFLIEALIISSRDSKPLTPELVLECCLNSNRFKFNNKIEQLFSKPDSINVKPLDEIFIKDLFTRWQTLLPKNKTTKSGDQKHISKILRDTDVNNDNNNNYSYNNSYSYSYSDSDSD
jgi:hypothetical protein